MDIGSRQPESARISGMRRISAIFVAICMVLIAGSLGAVLYLAVKLDVRSSAIVALAAFTAMALYNTISNRLRDRGDLGDQIGDLSRGTGDLARQVAELGRRINAMETRIEGSVDRARGVVDPIASEIGELGGLVRQIADTVAAHDNLLQDKGVVSKRAPPMPAEQPTVAADAPLALAETDTITARRFRGL